MQDMRRNFLPKFIDLYGDAMLVPIRMVSKIFISTMCLSGSGTIFIHAERLEIYDAPLKQN